MNHFVGTLLLPLFVAIGVVSDANLETFDACWDRVQQSFYDPDLHGVDWPAMRAKYRPRAAAVESGDPLQVVLEEMLAELGASHCTILPGPVYQTMLNELQGRTSWTLGMELEESEDGRFFVRAQYENGPGIRAGVLRGDEIVAVDGVPTEDSEWVVSAGYDPALPGPKVFLFHCRPRTPMELTVRSKRHGPTRETTIMPLLTNANRAAENSVQIIEQDGFRVGKIHLWYCARGVTEVLREALEGDLRHCDGLVIDLRGRGGFLHVAHALVAQLRSAKLAGQIDGPIAFLVDSRTRSAKEVMAHQIREQNLGTLVGERTEGAVLAASFFPLPDGSYLELPIMKVPVSSGVQLEGVGVGVDREVDSTLRYHAGRDPLLEEGRKVVMEQLRQLSQVSGPY